MEIVEELLQLSRDIFLPLGEIGLFAAAFISSIFPIPPDVILIPLVLFNPSLGLFYAFLATLAAVLGGITGYYIGLKGGRPLALRLVSESKIKYAEQYFARYGAWAVFIGAFSPIPYQIFTITSGIARLDLKVFIIASAIGRGARFFGTAVVLMIWGEQILQALMDNFILITFILIIAIIGGIISYRKIQQYRSRE